jgi:hypothetical protein
MQDNPKAAQEIRTLLVERRKAENAAPRVGVGFERRSERGGVSRASRSDVRHVPLEGRQGKSQFPAGRPPRE